MRIIISPAKKMITDTDAFIATSQSGFMDDTLKIYKELCKLSYDQLKTLWKCNDSIASLNYDRIKKMNLNRQLTPALLSYEGIQYQYMAPSIFEDGHFDYINTHLRILSGYYGMLRPFDGVTPYRLEMQAKLSVDGSKNLYDFWGSKLADHLQEETKTIINLASKEYSKCISKYLNKETRFITCEFSEIIGDKRVEKGTLCKMARGEMVRYMAEHHIQNPEDIKSFDRLNYAFSETYSSRDHFVFIKNASKAN